jgi:hypothetical protein
MFFGLTSLTVLPRSTKAMKGGAVVSQSLWIEGSALTKIWLTSVPLKSPLAESTKARTLAARNA